MADDFGINLDLGGIGAAIGGIGRIAGAVGGIGGLPLGQQQALATFAKDAARASIALLGLATAVDLASVALDAIIKGAQSLTQFGKAQTTLGSSPQTVAALRILGDALGVNAAAAAQELHQRIVGGGIPTGIAAGMGLRINPTDLAGFTDRGQELLKFLAVIRREVDAGQIEQARIQLSYLLPELAGVADMSTESMRRILKVAEEEAGLYTQDHIQRATEFNTQLAIFNSHLRQLGESFAIHVLPALNAVLEKANSTTNLGGSYLQPTALDRVRMEEKARAEKAHAALNRNTDAMDELARELRAFSGIYGGGRRARTAIPAAFGIGKGFAISGDLQSDAVKLGAYSVAL